MRLITTALPLSALTDMAQGQFADLVKAVVDIGRHIMVIGGELHSDGEGYLLDTGSQQADLWGINLYPASHGDPDWIEFDSMINLRPRQGNRTRGVDDAGTRQQITDIVTALIDENA
jgi:hypothetical protein